MAVVVVAAMTIALAAPVAADATVTIGSNLGRAPNFIQGCGGGCTFAQSSLPASSQASGGLVSAVNGTVVAWRIRSGGGTNQPVSLSVIRPLAGGLFAGSGRSAAETPAPNLISSFQTSLPIAIGDRIGIDCCDLGGDSYFVNLTGLMDRWFTSLGVGESRAPTSTDDNEIAMNADIEPTSAFKLDSVTPATGGGLTLTATVPNPGTLAAGDPLDPAVKTLAASSAKGKKKKKRKRKMAPVALLGSASTPVSAPGQVTLALSPTRAATRLMHPKPKKKGKRRKEKAKRRSISASVKVVFTPTGGAPATQTAAVRLIP